MITTAGTAPWSSTCADRRGPLADAVVAAGLLAAAGVLFGLRLGALPLRDWDEGTVARVAWEMWDGRASWLAPALFGQPYLNKPPLVHWLIAAAYTAFGVHEWSARLPCALLGAGVVPLVYGIGREVFAARLPAVLAAAVYMTLLPVVRHGRLAMLDAPLVFFVAAAFLCVLRARREPRWALGAGVALALACLAKGPVGLVFAGLALLFAFLEAPALLRRPQPWIGVGIAAVTLAAWYAAQAAHHGADSLRVTLVDQSVRRVLVPIEGNAGPLWYHALEVVKYGWPWLLFLPAALRGAWAHRRAAWVRLALAWGGGYLVVATLTATKLPWYTYPVYVPLALVLGAWLAEAWTRGMVRSWRWPLAAGGGLVLAGSLGLRHLRIDPLAVAAVSLVGVTLLVASALIPRGDGRCVPVLLGGCYVALALFVASEHAVWELREDYPVPPVAAMVRAAVPDGAVVHTTHPRRRPSLDFYSGRRVVPGTRDEIAQAWQATARPFVLAAETDVLELAPSLPDMALAGRADGFVLLTRAR